MAPRIDRLFDHTVQVWRPSVAKDNLGAERRSYALVDTYGAAVNRSVDPLASAGPGLAPTGRVRMYLRPDVDVQARDVMLITDGPNVGQKWEVDQPPVRPRMHHTQVDAATWNGILPEAS